MKKKITQIIPNYPKCNNVCSYGIFCLGLKYEFEIAMVNEPSVFEPLKFYCTYVSSKTGLRLLLIIFVFLFSFLSGCKYIFTYGSEKLSLSTANKHLKYEINNNSKMVSMFSALSIIISKKQSCVKFYDKLHC